MVRNSEQLRRAIKSLLYDRAPDALAVQGSFLARRIRLHETKGGPVRAIDEILAPFAAANSR